jgi:hypothetical protein
LKQFNVIEHECAAHGCGAASGSVSWQPVARTTTQRAELAATFPDLPQFAPNSLAEQRGVEDQVKALGNALPGDYWLGLEWRWAHNAWSLWYLLDGTTGGLLDLWALLRRSQAQLWLLGWGLLGAGGPGGAAGILPPCVARTGWAI